MINISINIMINISINIILIIIRGRNTKNGSGAQRPMVVLKGPAPERTGDGAVSGRMGRAHNA